MSGRRERPVGQMNGQGNFGKNTTKYKGASLKKSVPNDEAKLWARGKKRKPRAWHPSPEKPTWRKAGQFFLVKRAVTGINFDFQD
ncbi:MAG: hypothetical protein D6714_02460 [Bacteroidetes bacterium]|nr:MAG: hypothetical protein D6714_02460 [Bacteroidota bacterium]